MVDRAAMESADVVEATVAAGAAVAASRSAAVPMDPRMDPGTIDDGRSRWIQAGLALEVTTSVVAVYLDGKFREVHDAILDAYVGGPAAATADAGAGPSLYAPTCRNKEHAATPSPTCGKCSAGALLPQRRLANEFAARHAAHNPTWINANAQLWGTPGCHIEVAKLYSPKLGDHAHAIGKTDFGRLDGTALFNMMSWYTPPAGSQPAFPVGVAGQSGAAKGASDARNCWGHPATLSLDEAEFTLVITGFVKLLQILEADITAPAPNSFTEALADVSRIERTPCKVTSDDHLHETLKRLREIRAAGARISSEVADVHDSVRDLNAGVQSLAASHRELAQTQATFVSGLRDTARFICEKLCRIEEGVRAPAPNPDSDTRVVDVTNSHIQILGTRVPGATPFFAGRTAELEQLSHAMRHHPVGAIVGLGGGGKTQLMLNYAETAARTHMGTVCWVVGDDLDGLATQLADVAESLGRHVPYLSRQQLDVAAAAAFGALSELEGQWLVCVDNVDDSAVLSQLAKVVVRSRVFDAGAKSAGRMLVTSRHRDDSAWHNLGVYPIAATDGDGAPYATAASALLELGPLIGTESEVALFRRRFGVPSNTTSVGDVRARIAALPDDEIHALKDLAGAEHEFSLGGLPLALQQAGAYMASNKVSFVQYLDLFKMQFQKRETESVLLPAPDLGGTPGDDPADALTRRKLHTTWEINVELLPPKALRVLNAAALYMPDGIPKELLAGLAERCESEQPGLGDVVSGSDDNASDDGASRIMAFNNIVHSHLVNGASLLSTSACGDVFAMHRMVRMFVRERAGRNQELSGACVDALWAHFKVLNRHCGGVSTGWYLRTTAEHELGRRRSSHATTLSFCLKYVRGTSEDRAVGMAFCDLVICDAGITIGSLWWDEGIHTAASDELCDTRKLSIATDVRLFGADSVQVRTQKLELTAAEINRGAFRSAAGIATQLLAANDSAVAEDSTLWWCEQAVGHIVHGCELRRDAKLDEDMLNAMGHFSAGLAAARHVPVCGASIEETRVLGHALLEVLCMTCMFHSNPDGLTVEHGVAADMLSECVSLARRLRGAGLIDAVRVQCALGKCWVAHAAWGSFASRACVEALVDEVFRTAENEQRTAAAVGWAIGVHYVAATFLFKEGFCMGALKVLGIDLTAMLLPRLIPAPATVTGQGALAYAAVALVSASIATAAWSGWRGWQRELQR